MNEERYRNIFGKEYENFLESIDKHPKFSIRVNTLKISTTELKRLLENNGFILSEIPWYENGFFVENVTEVNPAQTKYHKDGLFFIQDASSMIPPLALNPTSGERVLDMCAAPGSKTTQMAMMMNNAGEIVAIERVLGRMKALQANIQRMGVTNVRTVLGDAKRVLTGEKFDKILLDAPCTGTGSCVSYLLKRAHKGVKSMSNIQKNLLSVAGELIKPGGTIVYSTCSLEPEENEAVIDFAINELGLTPSRIEIGGLPSSAPLLSWKGHNFDKDVSKCIRVFPTATGTEGFFIAKLAK